MTSTYCNVHWDELRAYVSFVRDILKESNEISLAYIGDYYWLLGKRYENNVKVARFQTMPF